jgi:hypothetical protein
MNAAGKNDNRAKFYSTPQNPEPHLPRSQPACPVWQSGIAVASFFTTDAKRLSFFFTIPLLHDGQAIRVSERTSNSNEALQTEHVYSNIGIMVILFLRLASRDR